MFGSKKEIETLQRSVSELTTQVRELSEQLEKSLKTLRQQTAGLAVGLPPSVSSILNGLPYSEINKEHVLDFIRLTPNLLILDVRSDEGWAQGHIPNAKHVPANQVFSRLQEIPNKTQPILTVCANGNTAVTIAQLLAREGYLHVFNALGGMAGYQGEVLRPDFQPLNVDAVQGTDRALISKVLAVLDRDVRPGLKRDGGDLEVISVESGVIKLKMVGACTGCGALQRTVEDGILKHLKRMVPEIVAIEDHTLGIPKSTSLP